VKTTRTKCDITSSRSSNLVDYVTRLSR